MTEGYTVEREDGPSHGRYVIRLGDGLEAELTYGRHGAATVVADHTYVPPDFRGHGLAERLMRRAIADAERDRKQILPLCSYVVAQFRRHPEWAHLRA